MTLKQSYETQRHLLTGMVYKRSETLVAQREYTYDVLGRPTARTTSRQGNVVNDSFIHNSRSELASTQVNGETYGYDYDNVGNRRMSMEAGDYAFYEANALNQYTDITGSEDEADYSFTPVFDADGNQTTIKTETGIWTAVYNAENRPVSFTNEATGTVVTCAYDSMGRRSFKQVTTNGTVTLHHRYLYRGYLQIACCDLTRSHHPGLWLITWDPTQPIATRPLAIQKDGTWYTYGLDLTKNVCEVFGSTGYIATTYTYTPYGSVTATGSVTQPIQWSSEVWDNELGMVYYNWRYYNAIDGNWNQKDFIFSQFNSYVYCKNVMNSMDYRGLTTILFAFFEDNDKHLARLNTLSRNYNEQLAAEVNRIRNKVNEINKKSIYCRQNMELFDWLRRQGVQFFWDNTVFRGTYDEYIRNIARDTLEIRHIKLGKTETIDALFQRLYRVANQYDNAIIMGHSEMPLYFNSTISESNFLIPRINGESERVYHSFFGERYTLMSCYMGDLEARTWDAEYFSSVFNVDLQPIPGSMYHHVISGSISYVPLRLRTYTGQELIEDAATPIKVEVEPMDDGINTDDEHTDMFPQPI